MGHSKFSLSKIVGFCKTATLSRLGDGYSAQIIKQLSQVITFNEFLHRQQFVAIRFSYFLFPRVLNNSYLIHREISIILAIHFFLVDHNSQYLNHNYFEYIETL
jgi:hypothetical protein